MRLRAGTATDLLPFLWVVCVVVRTEDWISSSSYVRLQSKSWHALFKQLEAGVCLRTGCSQLLTQHWWGMYCRGSVCSARLIPTQTVTQAWTIRFTPGWSCISRPTCRSRNYFLYLDFQHRQVLAYISTFFSPEGQLLPNSWWGVVLSCHLCSETLIFDYLCRKERHTDQHSLDQTTCFLYMLSTAGKWNWQKQTKKPKEKTYMVIKLSQRLIKNNLSCCSPVRCSFNVFIAVEFSSWENDSLFQRLLLSCGCLTHSHLLQSHCLIHYVPRVNVTQAVEKYDRLCNFNPTSLL